MPELESYRGCEFRGIEELAAAAAAVVEQRSLEPAPRALHSGITTRIVSQYLSEDLLGEPTRYAGTATLFNYGNLLRLLAAGKLLADKWSVLKVRELMAALDITALEQFVTTAFTLPGEAGSAPSPGADAAQGYPGAKGFHATQQYLPGEAQAVSQPTPSMSLAPTPLAESAKRSEHSSAEWIELATGLEIKIRRSFRPPRTEQERERLAARFWSVINKSKGI
ncbi:MAG TPA: hypothetical protein VF723_17930 [Pyrinomonadaceae bacterium]|jgi:hypothetical protein